MTKNQSPSFETAISELEQIVAQLESGDLELDQSLKLFERGIELTRLSQHKLQEAEQKVQILMEKNGQLELQPFQNQPEN
jgi:exodeoxyribonuclease VII small subunit